MLFVERLATTVALALLFALPGCNEKKASAPAKSEARALASAAPVASVAAAPVPKLDRQIFLMMEYRNEAPEYVHSAWFMDTRGNEFAFSAKQADSDLLRKIIDDSVMNAGEIEQLVAASKPLPRRVSEASLAQALAALSQVVAEPVEPVTQSPCNESGQTYLYAYKLEERLGVTSARFLRSEQCSMVTSRNPSQGASDLADWLEKLGKPKLWPL